MRKGQTMDDINMQKPEVPIIIIERDEQPQSKEIVTKVVAPSKKQKWLKRLYLGSRWLYDSSSHRWLLFLELLL